MAHYLIVLEEKPLFIGLLVYILAFGCAFVSDIDTLLVYVLYKVGSCAATVAAIAMVGICFRKRNSKVLSLLMLVVGFRQC
jgi:hypothetical protein